MPTAGRTSDKTNRRPYDPAAFTDPNDSVHLQESQQKVKLLEMDYKALHDKRLQDVRNFICYIFKKQNK